MNQIKFYRGVKFFSQTAKCLKQMYIFVFFLLKQFIFNIYFKFDLVCLVSLESGALQNEKNCLVNLCNSHFPAIDFYILSK